VEPLDANRLTGDSWKRFCKDILVVFCPVAVAEFVLLRAGLTHSPFAPIPHLFYRGMFRIYDVVLLHSSSGAASVPYHRNSAPLGLAGGIAAQLTYVIASACLSVLIVLVIRNFTRGKVAGLLTHPSLTFAAAAVWSVSWWLSNNASTSFPQANSPVWLGSYSPGILYFGLLVASAAYVIVQAFRTRVITWLGLAAYSVFSVLHFGFWFVTWRAGGIVWLSAFALTVFTLCAGALWLHRARGAGVRRAYPGSASWLGGLLAIAPLLFLFLPPRAHTMASQPDLSALKIMLQRTGCFGNCPVYSITITGTGRVTYVGDRNVATRGPELAVLSDDQLGSLLRDLDGINFFALDDRVFEKCFDTPGVALSASIGHIEKTVFTDIGCAKAATGPQAELVRIAAKIDRLVDSNLWTKCNGSCMQ